MPEPTAFEREFGTKPSPRCMCDCDCDTCKLCEWERERDGWNAALRAVREMPLLDPDDEYLIDSLKRLEQPT